MPFANSEERADHFHKHGADFGAKDVRDYEVKADAFLLGPKSSTALDYTRSQGDLVRFDPATDEFGVLSGSGEVRTYFGQFRVSPTSDRRTWNTSASRA